MASAWAPASHRSASSNGIRLADGWTMLVNWRRAASSWQSRFSGWALCSRRRPNMRCMTMPFFARPRPDHRICRPLNGSAPQPAIAARELDTSTIIRSSDAAQALEPLLTALGKASRCQQSIDRGRAPLQQQCLENRSNLQVTMVSRATTSVGNTAARRLPQRWSLASHRVSRSRITRGHSVSGRQQPQPQPRFALIHAEFHQAIQQGKSSCKRLRSWSKWKKR